MGTKRPQRPKKTLTLEIIRCLGLVSKRKGRKSGEIKKRQKKVDAKDKSHLIGNVGSWALKTSQSKENEERQLQQKLQAAGARQQADFFCLFGCFHTLSIAF